MTVTINLVCVEDALIAIGFRKMAAVTKAANEDTRLYYVPLSRRSLLNRITSKQQDTDTAEKIPHIAREVAQADIVAFSSMSDYSPLIHDLIAGIRTLNPKAYIVWGGCHPIIVPTEAIKHADAICTGEGEFAFPEFIRKFEAGEDFTDTENFWFNKDGQIIKNGFRPLSTNEELDGLPLLDYASDGEQIYDPASRAFVPVSLGHYIGYSGLGYNTIWSIGCPFRCTYCGNTKFIENDAKYRRMRHPSVDYLIRELKHVVARHPHISSIIFQDDSFLALSPALLQEFADRYKAEIDLPFAVFGVIPNYVTDEKFKILMPAGLNRIRMGVQSGSKRILEFYRRPSPPKRIFKATHVIGQYLPFMIPPAYDIIVDNPIETKEDIDDTLHLIYNLPRPFTLNLFSLRVMPNTDMSKQFDELEITPQDMDMAQVGYLTLAPTAANALLYLLCVVRPPKFVFEWWLKRSLPSSQEQTTYPKLNLLMRTLWLFRRGMAHLMHMDFVLIPGWPGYVLWKTGFIKAWRKLVVRKYADGLIDDDAIANPPAMPAHFLVAAEHDGDGVLLPAKNLTRSQASDQRAR